MKQGFDSPTGYPLNAALLDFQEVVAFFVSAVVGLVVFFCAVQAHVLDFLV